MTVTRIEIWDIAADFRDGPRRMSYGRQPAMLGRILKIRDSSGVAGYGEVARAAYLEPERCRKLENELLGNLDDALVDDFPVLCTNVRRDCGLELRGLAFALETAWFDLLGRLAGVPVTSFLGGRRQKRISSYLSFGCESPSELSEQIRERASGYRHLQFKLGATTPDDDCKRVAVAIAETHADQLLFMDFNGALDVETATTVINQFGDGDSRILWEEPCRTTGMNLEVAQRTGVTVMFDQCADSLPEIARVCASDVDACLTIKPARFGSLSTSRAACEIARDHGVRVRIDGPWGSSIGNAAALSVAVTVPDGQLFCGCDLTEPLVFSDCWEKVVRHEDKGVTLPSGPGLGLKPPESIAEFTPVWERSSG